MIDTGGTLCKAAGMLKEHGAFQVYAVATHGIFSGNAMEKINDSCLEEVCVTDSIPQTENLAVCPKLKVITLAPLLAEVIKRLHNEQSLSNLFAYESAGLMKHASSQSSVPPLKL